MTTVKKPQRAADSIALMRANLERMAGTLAGVAPQDWHAMLQALNANATNAALLHLQMDIGDLQQETPTTPVDVRPLHAGFAALVAALDQIDKAIEGLLNVSKPSDCVGPEQEEPS